MTVDDDDERHWVLIVDAGGMGDELELEIMMLEIQVVAMLVAVDVAEVHT